MGQRHAGITKMGAEVLGVAVTATFSQQAFAASLGLPFPLLSDWGRGTCRAYGVQYGTWKGHDGLAKRSIFVVGPDGIVRYRWVTDDALVVPDTDAALEALRQAR